MQHAEVLCDLRLDIMSIPLIHLTHQRHAECDPFAPIPLALVPRLPAVSFVHVKASNQQMLLHYAADTGQKTSCK